MPDDQRPIKLPLAGTSRGPLKLSQPELTTLIALWPGPKPPTAVEISTTLSTVFGEEIDISGEVDAGDSDMLWNQVVQLPGHDEPVFLWAEPAKPLDEGELGDGPEATEGKACKWVIGLQTPLDVADPLSSLVLMMRIITAAANDPPAVLDVEPGKWHLRPALEELFLNDDMEPPGDVLWSIHAVGLDIGEDCDGEDDCSHDHDGPVWLHTHGLWRCGKPELEMLDVPTEHALAAGHILNTLAELMLEGELAEPGEPFEIGEGLQVAVQPWQVVAKHLPEDSPGSMSDREEPADNPHTGVRAVVCAPMSSNGDGAVWRWPEQVVRELEERGATLYMTTRATTRLARRAQASWPELAMAFASLHVLPPSEQGEPAALFLLKVGLRENDDPSAPREHLWFEMQHLAGDRAQGRLLNSPHTLSRVKAGDVVWLQRGEVSDWQVITPMGAFNPAETGALQRFVQRRLDRAEGTA